jgi:putative ABC transport system substrate-binding protein
MAARGRRAAGGQAADHRVPYLGTATTSTQGQWVAALVQRLRDLGWIGGRTVAIEYRWAEGRPERFAEIAAEFVRLKVDVIVTLGGAVLATRQATSVIPIVFAAAGNRLPPASLGIFTTSCRR